VLDSLVVDLLLMLMMMMPTQLLMVLCFRKSIISGAFGLGGGIVKGPLMLEMGVLPPVTAASSATMILFSTTATSVAYYVFGTLRTDYGALLFVWGFVCTMTGQLTFNHILKKYKRTSFIILSIGVVIVMSVFLLATHTIMGIVSHPESALHVSGVCS